MNLLRKINENLAIRQTLGIANTLDETAATYTKIKAWEHFGCKTFVLTKELVEAFRHTDIPLKSMPNDFQYPFDTFLIESEVPLFKTDYGEDGMRDVFSILYSNIDSVIKFAKMTEQVLHAKKKVSYTGSLTAFLTLDDYLEFIFFYFEDNKSFESMMYEDRQVRLDDRLNKRVDESDLSNTMNIFYNTLMYINDPNRIREDTEVPCTRKVRVKEGEKPVKQSYILLKPPKGYRTLSEGTGRSIDVRFVVRGHWRNQAFGEKHSQHRMTWIKPYYKGPELAEVISKPYKVA